MHPSFRSLSCWCLRKETRLQPRNSSRRCNFKALCYFQVCIRLVFVMHIWAGFSKAQIASAQAASDASCGAERITADQVTSAPRCPAPAGREVTQEKISSQGTSAQQESWDLAQQSCPWITKSGKTGTEGTLKLIKTIVLPKAESATCGSSPFKPQETQRDLTLQSPLDLLLSPR